MLLLLLLRRGSRIDKPVVIKIAAREAVTSTPSAIKVISVVVVPERPISVVVVVVAILLWAIVVG